MKLLGTIKQVCDARTIWKEGSPIVYYPIIFATEESEFFGNMFASEDVLKRRGIQNGAVGHMEIIFQVTERKLKEGGTYPSQIIKFRDFRLANAGIFNDNAPAASGSTSSPSQSEEAPGSIKEEDLVF